MRYEKREMLDHLVSRHAAEVGHSLDRVGELLNLVEMICHQGSRVHVCHFVFLQYCAKRIKSVHTLTFWNIKISALLRCISLLPSNKSFKLSTFINFFLEFTNWNVQRHEYFEKSNGIYIDIYLDLDTWKKYFWT